VAEKKLKHKKDEVYVLKDDSGKVVAEERICKRYRDD
jgi:hypothetical protein